MGPADGVHGRRATYGLERWGTLVPGPIQAGPMSCRTRIVPLSCVHEPDKTKAQTVEGDARNAT
jgi:hypothetical protein